MPPAVALPDFDAVTRAAAVIKCLGNSRRLLLLSVLEAGESTVTDLQDAVGLSQAEVSRQLGILRGRGIVAARRDGPFVWYSIQEPKVHRILDCVRGCGA